MGPEVDTILAAIAPGFAASPSADTFKALAIMETDACYFGAMYNKAVALRAAHEWAMSTRGNGEAGALSSRRMGPVAVSFQNPQSNSNLSLTRFGRELQALISNHGVGASVTGADFPCLED